MYPEARRFGRGCRTDYPLGERNLSIRFSPTGYALGVNVLLHALTH